VAEATRLQKAGITGARLRGQNWQMGEVQNLFFSAIATFMGGSDPMLQGIGTWKTGVWTATLKSGGKTPKNYKIRLLKLLKRRFNLS
jgi:hypothetical protein